MPKFNMCYDQPRRILTFVLGGKARLSDETPSPLAFPIDPDFRRDATAAMRGKQAFIRNCLACHGVDAVAGGQAPDLRASAVPLSWESFRTVVHDGALSANGIPRFDQLSDATPQDIRQ